MVHLATLVHDDVVDGAEVRRNRPTLAANWGNKVSVLAGDCLFAEALRLAATLPSAEVCRLVSQSAKVVCTGEIRQTLQRGNFELGREEYLELVRMKTAELFSLACELGAVCRANEPQVHAARGIMASNSVRLIKFTMIAWMCLAKRSARQIAAHRSYYRKATLPVLMPGARG